MLETSKAFLGPIEDVALIHNPASGTRNVQREIERAATRLQDSGWRVEIYPTEGPGHAIEIAESAKAHNHTVVITASGDGVHREAARGLLKSAKKSNSQILPLGTIPTGTVNVFALEVGTPFDPVEAAEELRYFGVVRLMDTGEINGEPFVLNGGALMDAETFRKVQKPGRRKKARGLGAYVLPIVKTVPFYKGAYGDLTIGEETFTDTFTQVWAGNTRRLGHAVLWPEAQVDDGVLEFTAFTGRRGYQMLPDFFASALLRRRLGSRSIYRRGSAMELQLDREVSVQADGDSLPRSASIRTRVVPDSLKVVIPHGKHDLFSRV